MATGPARATSSGESKSNWFGSSDCKGVDDLAGLGDSGS